MNKKGDISLSFNMIFSIILIVAIIAIAIYAIIYFIDLKKCAEVSLFYRDLQEKVDAIWKSDTARDEFTIILPAGLTKVCFGNVTTATNSPEYDLLKRYRHEEANVFLYPPGKICGNAYTMINHVAFHTFSCVPLVGGKAKIALVKESYDTSTTLCTPSQGECTSVEGKTSNPLEPEPGEEENGLNIAQDACQRAQNGNLCDGITLVYGSAYKIKCCSAYNLCC